MKWKKSHDEFCLTHKITALSAIFLFKYIIRQLKTGDIEELELDLIKFNKWIASKRSRPYDPKTLKDAFDCLCDRGGGIIVEYKKYSWHCRKIIVKPVSFFAAKKSPEIGETPKDGSPNPAWRRSSNDERVQQQQQDTSTIDKLTKRIGLRYDSDALNRIWRLAGKSVDRVVKAIELMVFRSQSTDIPKPHGFLIECLKRNWQDGFDPYYEPELPRFKDKQDFSQYMADLRGMMA